MERVASEGFAQNQGLREVLSTFFVFYKLAFTNWFRLRDIQEARAFGTKNVLYHYITLSHKSLREYWRSCITIYYSVIEHDHVLVFTLPRTHLAGVLRVPHVPASGGKRQHGRLVRWKTSLRAKYDGRCLQVWISDSRAASLENKGDNLFHLFLFSGEPNPKHGSRWLQ